MAVKIHLSRSQQEINPNQEDWELMHRFARLFECAVNQNNFSIACEQAFQSALQACREGKWTVLSQEHVKDDIARLAVYQKDSLVNHAIVQAEAWTPLFLDYRIDIHSVDFQGNTALHTAAKKGSAHLIPILSAHIDIHKENNKKQTALEIAIESGKDEVVFELIKKHVNINRHILVGENPSIHLDGIGFAVMRGEIQCIKRLIVDGQASLIDSYNGIGNLLHVAIHFHQFEGMKYLLTDHKSKISSLINQKNHLGLTPLSFSASVGEQEPIRLLHEAGASIECKDNQQKRPIHYAAVGLHYDVIQLLAALGAKIEPSDENHKRPIDLLQGLTGRSAESCISLLRDLKAHKELRHRFPPSRFQPPKNLVFRGGGPKGLAFVGALLHLNRQNHLTEVKRVAGTSAGAITAALVAIGYPMDRLENLLMTKNLMDFIDHPLSKKKISETLKIQSISQTIGTLRSVIQTCSNIYQNPLGFIANQIKKLYQCTGLCDGEEFRKWIEAEIKSITGKEHLTFGELADLIEHQGFSSQFKHLHVYGTRVGRNPEIVHFSSQDPTCKDMIISDAIRISMSIPGVFKPHKMHILQKNGSRRDRVLYEDFGSFLDGGMLYNFPIETFDQKQYLIQEDLGAEGKCPKYNKETIGFSLFSSLDTSSPPSNIENVGELLMGICRVYLGAEEAIRSLNPYNQSRVIEIDVKDVGTLSFNMSNEKKQDLVSSGIQATTAFIEKRASTTTIPNPIPPSPPAVPHPQPPLSHQKGLNFIGKCSNISCTKFEQEASFSKAFGTFNLGKIIWEISCSGCQKKVKNISILVLKECQYTILGVNKEKEKVKETKLTLSQKELTPQDFDGWGYVELTIKKN